MNVVIFACVHNPGRSQMAAAWFNQMVDPAKARAISAGTQPGPRVHPEVQQAMSEVGIDLAEAKPQLLTDDLARGAYLLVTMGCGEACPYVPVWNGSDTARESRLPRAALAALTGWTALDSLRRCASIDVSPVAPPIPVPRPNTLA